MAEKGLDSVPRYRGYIHDRGEHMSNLTISQLAKQARVNVETIRYYERRGLLSAPARRASGYRQYSQQDVACLRFIRHAKTLGFSLNEIADLLVLRVDPDITCQDVRKRAERKLTEVDAKIRLLEGMTVALQRLIAACSGQGPTSACPILEALDSTAGND
jgi:MerR family transcriptional regulator, copper efflux regulator